MKLTFREATENDLTTILKILSEDLIRDEVPSVDPIVHRAAFEKISSDPNQRLIVVENQPGIILATFQLTTLQYLLFEGEKRLLIEFVRVVKEHQRHGVGRRIFEWIIALAKRESIDLIQLTSNKKRGGAIRFYRQLGFENTHEGFKMYLS